MHSRHNRTPSSIPTMEYDEDFAQPDFLTTLPKLQMHVKDSGNLKGFSRGPGDQKIQNFSYNYSNGYNDFDKAESLSNFSSEKGVTQLVDFIEEIGEDEPEDPLSELKEAVEAVLRSRADKLNKVNGQRKNVKTQLLIAVRKGEGNKGNELFSYSENGCSAEDISLVKFDVSMNKNERKRKIVKFKDQ